MKKMIKMWIGIGFVCLCILGLLFLKKKTDKSVTDIGGMEYVPEISSITYYKGGGELGDYYRLSLKNYLLTLEECEGNGCEEISKSLEVENDVYITISNIVEEYDLKSIDKLEESEIQVLDASQASLNIQLNDKNIELGDSYQMDEKQKKAMKEIVSVLQNAIE